METKRRDVEAAQAVARQWVDASNVEDQLRQGGQYAGERLTAAAEIGCILRSVRQRDIEIGCGLCQRKIGGTVHACRKHALILGKYGRVAVALVDVEIEDGGTRDRPLIQQG